MSGFNITSDGSSIDNSSALDDSSKVILHSLITLLMPTLHTLVVHGLTARESCHDKNPQAHRDIQRQEEESPYSNEQAYT
jgi:hypothetical protein